MRTRLTTGAVLVAAVALAGAALATPSTVTVDELAVVDGVATASGTVAFGDGGDGDVGGTPVTASPPQARPAFSAGADLESASITPLEDGSGLRFTWHLTDLPAGPPPEVVRYTWSFGIEGRTYQLQAKRTNVASTTALDDPAGHLTSAAAGAFQLRGNCTASYMGTPVSSCPHLQFLSGAFDTAGDRVTMDVPFGTQGIERGDTLVPVETAAMSITAGFQAAVSNSITSTYINGWRPYLTAPVVELATGFADDDPAALDYAPAVVSGGTWTGSTPVEEGAEVVVVRACVGATCDHAAVPLAE